MWLKDKLKDGEGERYTLSTGYGNRYKFNRTAIIPFSYVITNLFPLTHPSAIREFKLTRKRVVIAS